jgi:hypothetical protein
VKTAKSREKPTAKSMKKAGEVREEEKLPSREDGYDADLEKHHTVTVEDSGAVKKHYVINLVDSELEEAKVASDKDDKSDDDLVLDELLGRISYERKNEVEVATFASAIKIEGINDTQEDVFDGELFGTYEDKNEVDVATLASAIKNEGSNDNTQADTFDEELLTISCEGKIEVDVATLASAIKNQGINDAQEDTFDEELLTISCEDENEVDVATLASAIKNEGSNDAKEDTFDDELLTITCEDENEVEVATLASPSPIKNEGTNDAQEVVSDVDNYKSFDYPAALDAIRAISDNAVEESDEAEAKARTPNTDDMILELDESSWAKRCMDEFDLRAFPKSWEAPSLVNKMSLSDESAWRSYFEARVQLEEDSKEVNYDPDDDDKKEEDTYSTVYEIKIQAELSKDQGGLLQPHTAIRVTGVSLEDEILESARVVSTIFSPYMLPRAVQFCHRYHRRVESEFTRFYCTWYMQFISLADKREDDSLNLWRPCIEDLEVLCSNCYMTMPTAEIPWRAVEDIDTFNLSAPVVRRIREWLFGTPRSTEVMTDLELLKYAFASCGTSNFCTIYGTNGDRWMAKRAQVKDMLAYGLSREEVNHAQFVGVGWLEYQCRLISGDLRPIDQFYLPYDQRYQKGEWGKEVMEHRYEMLGTSEEGSHQDKPWMVWDRSSHRIESEDSMGYQMMSFIGGL